MPPSYLLPLFAVVLNIALRTFPPTFQLSTGIWGASSLATPRMNARHGSAFVFVVHKQPCHAMPCLLVLVLGMGMGMGMSQGPAFASSLLSYLIYEFYCGSHFLCTPQCSALALHVLSLQRTLSVFAVRLSSSVH